MDSHRSMSNSPGRSSPLSTASYSVEESPNDLPQTVPSFPPQSWPANSPVPNSSVDVPRDDNPSWSSLQVDQMKISRASSNATNNPNQPDSTTYSRRRAQNRASQRAFRERKERHVKNLEQQLEDLLQQYEELSRGYDQQRAEIFKLKAELEGLRSEKQNAHVSHNSPLEFFSSFRAHSYHCENMPSHPEGNELLIPHSQSLTPASNSENQNFPPRDSISERQTPSASLLPLTTSENSENSAIFRPSGPFFALEDASRCYSVNDSPDAQHQQQDDSSSLSFSKEFATIPSMDMIEGWR